MTLTINGKTYEAGELVAYVDELEKENAELKEEMKAKQVVLNDFKSRVETVTDRFNKKASQLTKAKEIIELGIKVCNTSSIEYMNWYQKKAEQFLKRESGEIREVIK